MRDGRGPGCSLGKPLSAPAAERNTGFNCSRKVRKRPVTSTSARHAPKRFSSDTEHILSLLYEPTEGTMMAYSFVVMGMRRSLWRERLSQNCISLLQMQDADLLLRIERAYRCHPLQTQHAYLVAHPRSPAHQMAPERFVLLVRYCRVDVYPGGPFC